MQRIVEGSEAPAVTHRRPHRRAAGSAALASIGCARAGRAFRRQWRDYYPEKMPADDCILD